MQTTFPKLEEKALTRTERDFEQKKFASDWWAVHQEHRMLSDEQMFVYEEEISRMNKQIEVIPRRVRVRVRGRIGNSRSFPVGLGSGDK